MNGSRDKSDIKFKIMLKLLSWLWDSDDVVVS